MYNQAYLLLGGNQGDVREIFLSARKQLQTKVGPIVSVSPLYKTEPWGFQSDEVFLNQVLFLHTQLTATQLLKTVQGIEKIHGRKRDSAENGYSSRPLDIDILFFNDAVITTPELVVPHPRLHLRNFTLHPLSDISPRFVHPVLNQTIDQLKNSCIDPHKVVSLETSCVES